MEEVQVYRPLTEEERTLSEKSLKRLTEELEYAQYQADHAQLMITKGLRLNYERQLSEYQQKYREINRSIGDLRTRISILHTQLDNGVLVKDPKTLLEDEPPW